jgi:Ankyrin repeat
VPAKVVISNAQDEPANAGAPWAWTAAEATTTENALLSWLIHLAAAANDVGGLTYCLSVDAARGEDQQHPIVGGIVNWINPASGRSPLHVAAMNGGAQSVDALLKSGALVHLRDTLGHTALYYVSDFLPSGGIAGRRYSGSNQWVRLRGRVTKKLSVCWYRQARILAEQTLRDPLLSL